MGILNTLTYASKCGILQDYMDNIRRIISLFVGLIVVLFLISYAFGKLGFYDKKTTTSNNGGALAGLFGKKAVSPTPNASKKITIKQIVDSDSSKVQTTQNTTNNQQAVSTSTTKTVVPTKTVYVTTTKGGMNTTRVVQTIPEAGAETALLPLLASALFGGVYLRRKS